MKALVQRVLSAKVSVDDQVVGAIGPGLLVLLGVQQGDQEADARFLADRTVGLRIFSDEAGRFNLSLQDTGGAMLVVSQFTLLADTSRGRRPSFTNAAPPEVAAPLVDRFIECIQQAGITTASGRFGAHMVVSLENDGPVTLMLESK